jgi:hypothetical protein
LQKPKDIFLIVISVVVLCLIAGYCCMGVAGMLEAHVANYKGFLWPAGLGMAEWIFLLKRFPRYSLFWGLTFLFLILLPIWFVSINI